MKRITIYLMAAMLLLCAFACAKPAEPAPAASAPEAPATDAPVPETAAPEAPVTEAPELNTPAPASEAPVSGTQAPEAPVADSGTSISIFFTAKALDGTTIDETYIQKNKVTVVNFWATWCPPCVKEIPDFSKVAAEYADKGCGFLGVQLDDDMDVAKKMWDDVGVVYPSVLPTGSLITMSEELQYIPVTMLLASDGTQIGEMQVGGIEPAALRQLIDDALAAAE